MAVFILLFSFEFTKRHLCLTRGPSVDFVEFVFQEQEKKRQQKEEAKRKLEAEKVRIMKNYILKHSG